MSHSVLNQMRNVYSYLINRKSFVAGKRRPAGMQICPLLKLTARQKRYFGFGKRLLLSGFKRPINRSLLMRTILLKTQLGNGSPLICTWAHKKFVNIRKIAETSCFAGKNTYLDYAGFLVAKNLWFLRNASTTPGSARLRRRKAFYGYQIRSVSTLSKLFGNLRFRQILKIYGLSANSKCYSSKAGSSSKAGKAWNFIQNIEALLPVICTKLAYATSMYCSKQSMFQNKLVVNGHPFSRNLQIARPGDFLTSSGKYTLLRKQWGVAKR